MRSLRMAAVCLVALLDVACSLSSQPSPTASEPALPPGFTRSTDHRLGFEIGLAPGWKVSQYDSQGSVAYSGPGEVAMVVHFEEASSTELRTAATVLLA